MYPSCIIFALASLKMAMGLAITTYPEVVPGPGLPSLAALGVTSVELYSMGWPNKSCIREARDLSRRAKY